MVQKRLSPEEMTLRQLRKVASELGISRYSRMRKSELIATVLEAQGIHNLSSAPLLQLERQEEVETKKFELGQENNIDDFLSSIDQGLTGLPNEHRKSQIVLMARDPEWAYAYWNIPNELKEELRRQGGQELALRIYDVTDINLDDQSPHSIQEYSCDELAHEWYIPIPVSDRNYVVEIGYRCADGRWLVFARSEQVHIPPVYPSDWTDDQFITVSWDEDLHGKTFVELFPASRKITFDNNPDDIAQEMLGIAEAEDQRVSGSIQMVPGLGQMIKQGVSSYAMTSGIGMWASGSNVSSTTQIMSGVGLAACSMGIGMSGAGLTASGVGLTTSGLGMSGVSLTSSGVGLTTSGISMGMSGVGRAISGVGLTSSGIGMRMSGVGLTSSGIGLNSSGIGLSMSGVGLTSSGIGLTSSGIGLTSSGIGLTSSGIGLSMSGVGLTSSGIGLTSSGIGMSMSGVGLTSSGIGISMSGVGLTSSGIGLTSSGIGMSMSGVGLTSSGIGLTSSGIGMSMSGVGLTSSGIGISMSGVGLISSGIGMRMSGVGLTSSGIGLTSSGIGMNMSGVAMNMSGIAASMPPVHPRQFWLVADAELIIHGATEPDATVTIGGRPIKLNSDGTFRFQIAFPDSLIDYPIMAVAVDGEQNRSIYMKFTRETPERRTNTKKEAILE